MIKYRCPRCGQEILTKAGCLNCELERLSLEGQGQFIDREAVKKIEMRLRMAISTLETLSLIVEDEIILNLIESALEDLK